MKIKIFLFFLLLSVSLFGQQDNQFHGVLQNASLDASSHPSYTVTGDVVSSSNYSIANLQAINLTVDTVWITLENTSILPNTLEYFYATNITANGGSSVTVNITSKGSNSLLFIPNSLQVFQSVRGNSNVFDGFEPSNVRALKLNHNALNQAGKTLYNINGIAYEDGDTIFIKDSLHLYDGTLIGDTLPNYIDTLYTSNGTPVLNKDTIFIPDTDSITIVQGADTSVVTRIDTVFIPQEILERDFGNGILLTCTEGFTVSAIVGGEVTITFPENGILLNGNIYTDKANCTYTGSGYTAGFRIVFDQSAKATPARKYIGHAMTYSGTVSPSNHAVSSVTPTVSQRGFAMDSTTDIPFNDITGNSAVGHDKVVFSFF